MWKLCCVWGILTGERSVIYCAACFLFLCGTCWANFLRWFAQLEWKHSKRCRPTMGIEECWKLGERKKKCVCMLEIAYFLSPLFVILNSLHGIHHTWHRDWEDWGKDGERGIHDCVFLLHVRGIQCWDQVDRPVSTTADGWGGWWWWWDRCGWSNWFRCPSLLLVGLTCGRIQSFNAFHASGLCVVTRVTCLPSSARWSDGVWLCDGGVMRGTEVADLPVHTTGENDDGWWKLCLSMVWNDRSFPSRLLSSRRGVHVVTVVNRVSSDGNEHGGYEWVDHRPVF